jgi:hypothetical protein
MFGIQKYFLPSTVEKLSEPEYKVEKPQIKIDTNFKLPIAYLEDSETFQLSEIVANDLELTVSSSKSMYEYLFNPSNKFAKDMIENWKEKYTTNQEYLKDTQKIVIDMSSYKDSMLSNKYEVDCDKILSIWEDLKVENGFLDRYGYMEWEMLAHLNESSNFLQCLTVMNVLSPAISLLIPIFFLIFPFLILKIQGIPISFEIYFMVLKDLARNHFIGRALTSMESLSWDKVVYLLVTFGLYLLQIYQNVNLCQNFYKNVVKINTSLIEVRDFTRYSIQSMEKFLLITKLVPTYEKLSIDIRMHCEELKRLYSELQYIRDFEHSVNKFTEVGYILKCYYKLHSNKYYEDSLRYAFGFEGYVNNLLGVHNNVLDGNLAFADFESTGNCKFEEQYYPPLINEFPVKNNCSFDKNMIISSPNKSGKTTILKTVTINIIFTQQIGCGFYKSATLNPYTHIHSYLNIPDTSGRDSLFQAESRRCKEIIDIINEYSNPIKYRHFCIFDELYSGTNPEEASKAGYAFLKYLTSFNNVSFILTTHYFSICKKFNKSERVQNYKMEVIVLEDGRFEYTYKIKKGISKIKGGIRVLKDMDYPSEIIKTIERR